jgi:hypothetical protein
MGMDIPTRHLTPADYVIRAFGGVRPLARALGANPSSVSRWPKARAAGGCDGAIPTAQQKKILDLAKIHGKDITEKDLISGREVEVV